jgi:hypothetical protein
MWISGTVDMKVADRRSLVDRDHAFHRVDDVLGGDRAAVVELGARLHLEAVDEAIVGDRVALGQPRRKLRRIVEPAIKAVVEIEARGDAAVVEHGMRIERVVFRRIGEDEGRRRLRLRDRAEPRRREADGRAGFQKITPRNC